MQELNKMMAMHRTKEALKAFTRRLTNFVSYQLCSGFSMEVLSAAAENLWHYDNIRPQLNTFYFITFTLTKCFKILCACISFN